MEYHQQAQTFLGLALKCLSPNRRPKRLLRFNSSARPLGVIEKNEALQLYFELFFCNTFFPFAAKSIFLSLLENDWLLQNKGLFLVTDMQSPPPLSSEVTTFSFRSKKMRNILKRMKK